VLVLRVQSARFDRHSHHMPPFQGGCELARSPQRALSQLALIEELVHGGRAEAAAKARRAAACAAAALGVAAHSQSQAST